MGVFVQMSYQELAGGSGFMPPVPVWTAPARQQAQSIYTTEQKRCRIRPRSDFGVKALTAEHIETCSFVGMWLFKAPSPKRECSIQSMRIDGSSLNGMWWGGRCSASGSVGAKNSSVVLWAVSAQCQHSQCWTWDRLEMFWKCSEERNPWGEKPWNWGRNIMACSCLVSVWEFQRLLRK